MIEVCDTERKASNEVRHSYLSKFIFVSTSSFLELPSESIKLAKRACCALPEPDLDTSRVEDVQDVAR